MKFESSFMGSLCIKDSVKDDFFLAFQGL